MSLTAFLAQNAEQVENVKYVASPRFKDEAGKPIAWEIRCISNAEDDALRKSCVRRIPVSKKTNQFTSETDMTQYLAKLGATCTVYPNLYAEELQNSYGVMGAEALLKKMLTPGEYADYVTKVLEVCGFDEDFEEIINEAKN